MGAFTSAFREQAISQWARLLGAKSIPCSENFKLETTLGDAVKIRGWVIDKLPNDSFSIDNAIMLFESNRWPLMIDPQGQANKWVKKRELENQLKVVKQNQVRRCNLTIPPRPSLFLCHMDSRRNQTPHNLVNKKGPKPKLPPISPSIRILPVKQANFVRTIENAIQFGSPILLENVPESLDPVLEPVLLKQVVTVGGVSTIRMGDNNVEYDPNFRLYISTKMTNPHYPPELCVKVGTELSLVCCVWLRDDLS